jgi:hypothetical protein
VDGAALCDSLRAILIDDAERNEDELEDAAR